MADVKSKANGLVQQVRRGDGQAGSVLVETNYGSVYRWFLWMGNDANLAADLTQDTFVALWDSLDRFREEMPLTPWLFGIAHNIWRKHCSRNSRHITVDEENLEQLSEPDAQPEKVLLSKEAGQALEEAVAKLPEEYRTVLVLRFWEDMEYTNIAQTLSISEGLARWRVHRGRKLLQEKLQVAGVMDEAFVREGGKLGWWMRMHERPGPPSELLSRCLATVSLPRKSTASERTEESAKPLNQKPNASASMPDNHSSIAQTVGVKDRSEPVFVATLEELKHKGCVVVQVDVPVVVFYDQGNLYALDNRCPHMGFPLHRGTVHEGVLTCWWHHARFDLTSGCTFDLWADDASTYPVEVRDEEVWLLPRPPRNEVAYWRTRLKEGMQHRIDLVTVKAVNALLQRAVDDRSIVRQAALFGTCYREDWGQELTILAAMANLLPYLPAEDKVLPLWAGVRNVGNYTQNQAPHWEVRPLETEELSVDRLKEWLRQWAQVRHEEGAERSLVTAIVNGATPNEIADLLFSTATDRIYARSGHVVDFCNKALEMLDVIGWEHAAEVLPTLIDPLVWSRGGEESTAWRQPYDLVPMLEQVTHDLPELLAAGARARETDKQASLPDETETVLLGDDPVKIVAFLKEALRTGVPVLALSKIVTHAAAMRICRFSTSNEFVDWDTVLHTFSYCNAIHQALKRIQTPEVVRGLFHGALSVYLDRFLNVPPAPLPGERGDLEREPADAGELCQSLLSIFDRMGAVNDAGRLTARYLSLGHPVERLIRTLIYAVVREDAKFHVYQVLEAAVSQYEEWRGSEKGTHFLVAASRFIAAHSPTERKGLQTAQIARRLLRGDALHEQME